MPDGDHAGSRQVRRSFSPPFANPRVRIRMLRFRVAGRDRYHSRQFVLSDLDRTLYEKERRVDESSHLPRESPRR